MLLTLPHVLDAAQVAQVRTLLQEADWADGRLTAGHQSAQVKANLQLPEGSPLAQNLGNRVLAALERNPRFLSAALPQRVYPPLFNRYGPGMGFGSHVDNAIRALPGSPERLRTDLSATLFLSEPESYDGGELLVEDTYGLQAVKLPAGHMVLYPATSLHRVAEVTRGERLAAFFWMQSLVREDAQRTLLYDLDLAVQQVRGDLPDHPSLLHLTACYHNLLRMWAQP